MDSHLLEVFQKGGERSSLVIGYQGRAYVALVRKRVLVKMTFSKKRKQNKSS
jgi:hypothetical protein